MTATKLSKCPCNNCSSNIEFEADQAAQTVSCPHCGLETILFIPSAVRPSASPRRKVSLTAKLITLAVLLFLTLVGLIVWFGLSTPELVRFAGGAIGLVIAVIVACFLVLWAILWVIFPVFVYYGLKRLEKLLGAIERNTRK